MDILGNKRWLMPESCMLLKDKLKPVEASCPRIHLEGISLLAHHSSRFMIVDYELENFILIPFY